MKRLSSWLFLAVAVCFVCIAETRADDRKSNTIVRIDERASEVMDKYGVPGLSIAVAVDNRLIYENAFGLSDVENDVLVTTGTRFRTASVAKPMTAAVVLSLVEDGKLELDDEVQAHCKSFPKKKWPVTVRQVLGHLGGVRHYKNSVESSSTEHFYSLESALTTFADDPLKHEPGTKYLYSSFGYNLLGSIAEASSGKDFMTLLEEKVFAPAEMTQTVRDDQFTLIPGRSRGYFRPKATTLARMPRDHDLVAGELYNASLHDTSMKIPGGGLLSTAADLVRFGIAMNTGKVVHQDTRGEMWTTQKTADRKETGYGLGWRISRSSGREVIWHSGGQSGTSTVLAIVPETGTCVSIMCNLQDVSLYSLALAVADLVQPTKPVADYREAIVKLKGAIDYEVEQKQLPAFSISLVDKDEVVWSSGFGYQDAGQTTRATADTVYRVGSVSKLFTDIALLQLVEDGKLDLDANVQDYVPSFQPKNPYNVAITLRQLMSHRS